MKTIEEILSELPQQKITKNDYQSSIDFCDELLEADNSNIEAMNTKRYSNT